jgi:LysM repeat protein
MVARNRGRYLAPIALAVVIVVTVLVIHAGVGTTHHSGTQRPADRLPVAHHTAARKKFYVVQAGDSLSQISVKTGISVPTLESLNPGVDPNALQTGQRLRLRH